MITDKIDREERKDLSIACLALALAFTLVFIRGGAGIRGQTCYSYSSYRSSQWVPPLFSTRWHTSSRR